MAEWSIAPVLKDLSAPAADPRITPKCLHFSGNPHFSALERNVPKHSETYRDGSNYYHAPAPTQSAADADAATSTTERATWTGYKRRFGRGTPRALSTKSRRTWMLTRRTTPMEVCPPPP